MNLKSPADIPMVLLIAFAGHRRLAAGSPADVAVEVKRQLDAGEAGPLLVFDAATSRTVELDLRGDEAEIRARLTPGPESAAPPSPARGRPRLGVVAREVTLLPRQWDWLSTQRGGASAALRRLVSEAQREGADSETRRLAQESLHRFLTVIAGDAPGYEEAVRALFAGDETGFRQRIAAWPADVRSHALALSGPAFESAQASLARRVPAEQLTAVRQALGAVLGDAALTQVEPLTAGASDATVLAVRAGRQRCVLKLDRPDDGLRSVARTHACHAIAAQAQVAPRLLYSDVERRLSISAHVEGEPIEARDRRLTVLAQALRRLHAAPRFPPLMSFLDAMARLLAAFAAAGIASADLAGELDSQLAQIRSAYRPAEADIVSSHNDLNPLNILYSGGRALLVDWETAFAADRYVDLAAVINFQAPGEAAQSLILTEYFGRAPQPVEVARLTVMRQVSRLFYGVMLLLAARRSDPGFTLPHGASGTSPADDPRLAADTPAGRIALACSLLAQARATRAAPAFCQALAEVDRR